MKSVLSLYDFLNRFPSEGECFQYLVEKRWPDGFRCPPREVWARKHGAHKERNKIKK